jgi:hypothetical protein
MALKRFRAPPLPYPGPLYTAEQQRALVRNIELYFSQLDSKTPNFAESYTADAFYGGSFFQSSSVVTADATVGANIAVVLVDATGGATTITLPAAASNTGRVLTIKKIDVSGNTMTLDPDGSETIDGNTTVSSVTQHESFTIFCDGTEWWIL